MDAARSLPFRLSRLELARIAAWEYARGYWWMFIAIPLFGLAGLAVAPDGVVRYFCTVCLLWPFSIPARAILITGKAQKLFAEDNVAVVEAGFLRLYRPSGKGSSLNLANVRSVEDRWNGLIVRTKKLGFVALPAAAFQDGDHRAAFKERLLAPEVP